MKETKGMTLTAARYCAGISQKDAAIILGISRAALSNYENGKASPTADLFISMCRLYSVPVGAVRI